MDKAERQKVILLVLMCILVGYFGYTGVGVFRGVSGMQADAARLQREREDLQQQVNSATVLVTKLGQIKKEREGLELQLKEISRRLPSEHESPQVLRSVETLAGNSGLTVTQVKRRPGRPQELYVEIPMEVTVGGGYHELVKFADSLSHIPRLVTLNEFRVQIRGSTAPGQAPDAAADAAPGTLSARLVAVVFQALPESAPGAAAKP